MTDFELRERCAYWQRVLRLQDWRVDVRIVSTEELDSDQQGQCAPHADSKTATIKILDPAAYNQTSRHSQVFPEGIDPEVSLVHELIHIHFDMLIDTEDDEHAHVAEEQAIEFIAEALVGLDRRGPGAED